MPYGSNLPGVEDIFGVCPGIGQVKGQYLRGIDHALRAAGGNPVAILASHDVVAASLYDPDFHIDLDRLTDLLERCGTAVDDPVFGASLATRQDPDVFGCLMAFAKSAPSVKDALGVFAQHIKPLICPSWEMELDEQDARLGWTFGQEPPARQMHYHALVLLMKALRRLAPPFLQPRAAGLPFEVPTHDRREIARILDCDLLAQQEASFIRFDPRVLVEPLLTSDPPLFKVLSVYVEHIGKTSLSAVKQQVLAYIAAALPSGFCTLERCSEVLGIPDRTLQKQLARMGESFSGLVQEERIRVAKHALATESLDLDEIAFRLGYSEQASFTRAFKRWAGLPPSEYRLKALAERASAS